MMMMMMKNAAFGALGLDSRKIQAVAMPACLCHYSVPGSIPLIKEKRARSARGLSRRMGFIDDDDDDDDEQRRIWGLGFGL